MCQSGVINDFEDPQIALKMLQRFGVAYYWQAPLINLSDQVLSNYWAKAHLAE